MAKPAKPAVLKRKPLKLAPQPRKIQIVMDSGAYSAWRLGKPINLEEYCDFLLENLQWIEHYVGLDVINPQDPEAAAAQGFANLQYMLKRGLKPVHVYHPGEDIDWLYRMLDAGCDYIGLAALSLGSYRKSMEWYAQCWAHLVDSKGRPVAKVHAFGDGRFDSLSRFPWRSADSTSWVYAAQRHGAFLVDGNKATGRKLSHRNDGGGNRSSPDIDSLPPMDEAAYLALLHEAGVDPAGFAERGSYESTVLRTYLTMKYYAGMRDRLRAKHPVRYHAHGLFAPEPSKRPGLDLPPMDFYLVVGGNPIAQSCLAYGGYDQALVSYFYVLNTPHYDSLSTFAFEPEKLCSTDKAFMRSWQVLERFVRKES